MAEAAGSEGEQSSASTDAPSGSSSTGSMASTANDASAPSVESGTESASASTSDGGAPDTGDDGMLTGTSRSSEGDSTGNTVVDGEAVEGDVCQFVVHHTQSAAIGTVTIVHWSTDFGELQDARIEFGPADAEFSMAAPVDLSEHGFRTLLLGMKADRDYRFRIIASAPSQTCTSHTLSVRTGPLPAEPPVLVKTTEQAGGAEGFIIATPGLTSTFFSGVGFPAAYIFDSDGDVVWWSPPEPLPSSGIGSARMSWDGDVMWYVSAQRAELYKTSMDGLEHEEILGVVGHHDLTPLPEGGIATFDATRALVEVLDDGTVRDIALLEDLYVTPSARHPNYVVYHPLSDTFTISDRDLLGFVKLTRDGELLWQLGGEAPLGNAFEPVGLEPWGVVHGHHMGPHGEFLFYNNLRKEPVANEVSRVIELQLDEATWTATLTWQYELSSHGSFLGNVQRLASGNTLIVHSMGLEILEVTPSGELVQSFSNADLALSAFGYAEFRASLYGPTTSTWQD